jgi:surfactin synthase thioesterase subunit
VPVTGLAAVDDPEVDAGEVAGWRRLTAGPFQLATFTGGHLFPLDHGAAVRSLIADGPPDRSAGTRTA